MIPEKMKITNGMLLEHLARYYFAMHYAKGRILDFACGTGYGSKLIARSCKETAEIVAVDIDASAIEYALKKHYHPKVKYVKSDATDTEIANRLGLFDVIISFETLEHVNDETAYLQNIFQMLKPGGTLIISTPFGAGRGKPTKEPFHIHQLTEEEFLTLFNHYSEVDFYYQKSVLIEPKRPGKHYPFGIAVCTK
ncbi:class I SAM-dependent methyltransferase [Mesobacillus foraminis]|uniref:class I SAM-dependent methyltransferase n=1 Tax=Mesobacillus foraminis TaxID=279826 RepID=UPI001BE58E6D|nr:class I SAM-dependent methyltransferase [Mesobacillus foraminis]MBT2757151.1 class I SAM-dependent methyltransferase [Mesobacillus foraminis]